MANSNRVTAKQNPETTEWEVKVAQTGEVLVSLQSRYLACKMVSTINRNLDKE